MGEGGDYDRGGGAVGLKVLQSVERAEEGLKHSFSQAYNTITLQDWSASELHSLCR
jgi:hypothetical protein